MEIEQGSLALKIPPKLVENIEAHARREYPKEACGFLVGGWSGGTAEVSRALAVPNSHFSNPHERYAVTHDVYHEAEQIAARHNMVIVGVYHTHPNHPAVPSRSDLLFAFPDWIYWISPVFKDRVEPARAFLRRLDVDKFEEVRVEIV